MESREAFGLVLRMAREKKGISQESFSDVSSRTYISGLERGLKNPTLDKIGQIGTQLGVHPLTLLIATFSKRDGIHPDKLIEHVREELENLMGNA